jgi:hypothetical protein
VEEDEEDADWGDAEPTSSAVRVDSVTTTSAHGPIHLLLLLGVYTSRLLSLRRLHLRRPQLLLRGRRLLREKHLSTFSVATHLRP